MTVIRLKIEQAADKIDSQLAEELDNELTHLTLHVERAILISRAEQGNLQLNRSQFDLGVVLSDLAEGFKLLAAEERRSLEIETIPAPIYADPAYTKQILYNLLSNALRHGRGTIQVRMKRSRHQLRVAIGNHVKTLGISPYNLGLGKRIVQALASAQGQMDVAHRLCQNYYVAQLSIRCLPTQNIKKP